MLPEFVVYLFIWVVLTDCYELCWFPWPYKESTFKSPIASGLLSNRLKSSSNSSKEKFPISMVSGSEIVLVVVVIVLVVEELSEFDDVLFYGYELALMIVVVLLFVSSIVV